MSKNRKRDVLPTVPHHEPSPKKTESPTKSLREMTPRQIAEYAKRHARNAIQSCRMDVHEFNLYARAIFDAVQYFNLRDAHHAEYMRYLHECQHQQEEEARRRDERKKEKPYTILIR